MVGGEGGFSCKGRKGGFSFFGQIHDGRDMKKPRARRNVCFLGKEMIWEKSISD